VQGHSIVSIHAPAWGATGIALLTRGENNMPYNVIVHTADGECSTEGSFDHRDTAMWYAIRLAENLDAKREWVYVCGFIVKGKKSN